MVAYQFYVGKYHGGSIQGADWPAAEREAQAEIRRMKSMYRVTPQDVENAEDMAVCAVAEVLSSYADREANGGAVTSASIGSVSESFASSGTLAEQAGRKSKDVYRAASLYLDIYRGCGPCC